MYIDANGIKYRKILIDTKSGRTCPKDRDIYHKVICASLCWLERVQQQPSATIQSERGLEHHQAGSVGRSRQALPKNPSEWVLWLCSYVYQDETCNLLLLIKSDPNRWLFSIVAGILAHSVAEDAQLCFSMAVYGIVSSVVLYPCLLHLNTKEARFECTLLLRRALFSKKRVL